MLNLDHYIPDSPYNVHLRLQLKNLEKKFKENNKEVLIKKKHKTLLIQAYNHYRQFDSDRIMASRIGPSSKKTIEKIKSDLPTSNYNIRRLIEDFINVDIDDMRIQLPPSDEFWDEHPHIYCYGFADWINILLEHEQTFNKIATTIENYLETYIDFKIRVKFATTNNRKLYNNVPTFVIHLKAADENDEEREDMCFPNSFLIGTDYPFKLIFFKRNNGKDDVFIIERPEDFRKYVFDLFEDSEVSQIRTIQIFKSMRRKIEDLTEKLEFAPTSGPNQVITNLIDKYQTKEREQTIEEQTLFLLNHQDHYDNLLETINKIMADKWGFNLDIKLFKTCDNHIGMANDRIRFNLKTQWSACDIVLFGKDYPYQIYLEENEQTVQINDLSDWEKIAVYFVTHPPENLRQKCLN